MSAAVTSVCVVGVTVGALIVAIDGALQQIECIQPHLAPLFRFGRAFLDALAKFR
jgi:hypothetical protein